MLRLEWALAALLLASVGCTKKDDAPATAKPSSVNGDGGSKASPLALGLGKRVEGVLCPTAPWFMVVPPTEGKIHVSLQVPKGAEQFCVHLHVRDAAGKLTDTLASPCSEDTGKPVEMTAPISKDAVLLSIDQNDPGQKCIPARYGLWIEK